tara:strand:- start:1276 stop:1776 length:501 start_codon:yes stop_codon:yes gene_type:complete
MEIKKGIVKSVQSNGSLKLQHGIFHKFEIEIGEDVGEYLSKSEDGGNKNFPVGQEKEYQLTETSYGKKIKPHFQQNSFTPRQAFGENPDKQRMIVKQSSIKVALEFMVAKKPKTLYVDDVLKVADKIVSWVMEDKPVETKSTSIGDVVQTTESTTDKYHSSEDLPF